MSDKKGKAKSQNLQRTASRKKQQALSKPSRRTRRPARKAGAILAPVAMNPMRAQRVTQRGDGSHCRIKGTDLLTSVTIGGTAAAAGDVLVSQIVNPAQLGVARLATMSRLYERYKFRSLKFRYAPVANATVSGQLIGYVDYDTYDDPTGVAGIQNLQRAAAHYGEKPVQVWQGSEAPVFWEIKDIDPLTDLYVDSDGSDARWTNQGRFVLLAASAIASSTACGVIYIDYDVEFYIPQLELTPSNGSAVKLTGSTSCTTSAILGTAIAAATWSNIPWSMTGNVLSLQAGCYCISAQIIGGTIAALDASSTGTSVWFTGNDYINAAATGGSKILQVYSTSAFTVTFSATAASISGGTIVVALLPRDAISLSARKIDRISGLLRRLGDLSEIIDLRKDSKESKEAKVESLPVATGSTSSFALSGQVAGAYASPLKVNEQYVLVRSTSSRPPG